MSEIKLTTDGLDRVIRSLKGTLPSVKVGILGDTNSRSSQVQGMDSKFTKVVNSVTNAEVGAAHEFGTSKLPKRSFLRMPLLEKLDTYLENSKAFDADVLKKVVTDASIIWWMKKVAITCEVVIADAFDTAGFGKWKPWKRGRTNNSGKILVDTTQLRDSITSEVK